jgi:hypothetical protein
VYYIYGEDVDAFLPKGLMPTEDGLAQSAKYAKSPHQGMFCYRAVVDLRNDPWKAVAFLPKGLWRPAEKINVLERIGARKGDRIALRYWARSPDRVTIQIKVGGGDGDSMIIPRATKWLALTPDWRMYTLELSGTDLSGLITGLTCVIDREHNPGKEVAEFHLDEVYFTRVHAR